MKTISRLAMIAGLGLALAGQTHAATLSTSVVVAPFSQTLYCDVVNTRTSPVQVTIETHDGVGGVVDTLDVTLPPDQGVSLHGTDSLAYTCVFKVKGSSKSVAAMAVYVDLDNGHYTVSSPAR